MSHLSGRTTSLRSGPTTRTQGYSTQNRTRITNQIRQQPKNNIVTNTTGNMGDETIFEDGKDVTPKILITPEILKNYEKVQEQKDRLLKSQQAIKNSQMESSSVMKQSSNDDESSRMQQTSMMQSSMLDSRQSASSDYSDDDSRSRTDDGGAARRKKAKEPKGPTEEELNEDIAVLFQETPTMTLLWIPSCTVSPDNQKLYEEYQKINKYYDELLKSKAGRSDNFGARPTQTFNYGQKVSEQNTIRIDRAEAKAFAADWDIHKTMKSEQLTAVEEAQLEIKKLIEEEMEERLKNEYSTLSTKLETIRAWSSAADAERARNPKKPKDAESNSHTTSHVGGLKSGNTGAKSSLLNSSTTTRNKLASSVTRTTKRSIMNDTMTTDNAPVMDGPEDLAEEEEVLPEYTDEERKIFENPNLNLNLKYIERILNLGTFHKQIVTYRNYPEFRLKNEGSNDPKDKKFGIMRGLKTAKREEEKQEQKEEISTLNFLFKFNCELTKGHTVTSVDWNSINPDLLAASYGECELSPDSPGYLMFWTLKNPNYPERIIKTPSRVMSCKFSKTMPNLIATGWYNGVVAIYDIRVSGDRPIADSRTHPKKHLDIVWEVQWTPRGSGNDKAENIISISSDGRVVEWFMKKGLECQDIMTLKRQTNPSHKDDNIEGMNFRTTSGFSFDFLKQEGSLYLASTEDGTVHRCSKSYTEQALESYFGHKGPVYKVRANPFCSDLFLTCSADWSCRLWNWKEEQYRNIFQNLDLFDEVLDIEWNPWMSTMFASVAKDGRLELWDLAKDVLDPIAAEKPKDDIKLPPRKTVKFSPNSPILVTGDYDGDINVYNLHGFDEFFNMSEKQQEERIIKAVYPTGYNKHNREEMDH